uniref:DC-STAMP domain containing 1 n=1 Tax=Iconisemion striatum TaxID=60296 RepID=A0A1A7W850_9TELE
MFQCLSRWGRGLFHHPKQEASDFEVTHYADS